MAPIAFDVSLSPVAIDPRVNRARSPVLPAAARGPDFESRFDPLTLFYDCFWEASEESILVIGPHIPGHLDPDQDIQFFCLGSGERLDAEFLPARLHFHGDMYRIAPHSKTSGLRVACGNQHALVAIQPNLSSLLAGRRVLTNRCFNDPLEWLVDWAYFHAREFGFDAIVHYDNGSTAYTIEDVRRALIQVPGIEVAIVLSWPFPMEPAHAAIPQTAHLFWQRQVKDRWADSSRLEHQRRRFLAHAELVLVADVDELLMRRRSTGDIAELFADPSVAWVKLDSELVVNTLDPQPRLMRHRDLHWIWKNQSFKTPKYLVRPDRCPEESRWWLHSVAGAHGGDIPASDFTIAHFFALSTGWGGKHHRSQKHIPTLETHEEDMQLRATLDRVFVDDFSTLAAPSTAPNDNPHLLRRDAYTMQRSGDQDEALTSLNRAIALDPYHPVQYQVRSGLFQSDDSSES